MPKLEEICFKVLSNQAMTLPQHLQVKEDGESSCVAQLEVGLFQRCVSVFRHGSLQKWRSARGRGRRGGSRVALTSAVPRRSTWESFRRFRSGSNAGSRFDSMYFFPPIARHLDVNECFETRFLPDREQRWGCWDAAAALRHLTWHARSCEIDTLACSCCWELRLRSKMEFEMLKSRLFSVGRWSLTSTGPIIGLWGEGGSQLCQHQEGVQI